MAERVEERSNSGATNEQIAEASVDLMRSDREINEAVGRKRALIKRHKGAGVPIEGLLSALKIRKLDNDEARKKMRDFLRCALVIAPDLPLRQEDLFDRNADFDLADKAGAQLNEWNAEEEGYKAAIHGGSLDDCPFEAGSPYQVKYHQGFANGQKFMAGTASASEGVVASTSRRKPRRNGIDENGDAR